MLLHEHCQMGLLEVDAPFRSTDLPDAKAAWLHEHKPAILEKYREMTNGAELVLFLFKKVLHEYYIIYYYTASSEDPR